jgi:Mn2+/Fe2+ NRAMP family transporter
MGSETPPTPPSRITGLHILGPGVLLAAAAIGASHLVQSTRAGASFGFQLLWLVVLACILKYPFFEFGQRYSAATGETLLRGYRRLGRGSLAVFLGITNITMVVSISALTFLTAILAQNFTGWMLGPSTRVETIVDGAPAIPATWPYSPLIWAVIICAVCNGLLAIGRYRTFDRVTKVIVAVLGITAVIAAIAAAATPAAPSDTFAPRDPWVMASLPFLLALMGWMPAPIELSAWSGVWMNKRHRETGFRPSVREALIDFNTGYLATIVLSVAFLSLGALVMYPTGESFSEKGAVFAQQFVNLFRSSIGAWVGPVVMIAAFTCMFSTTLTCLDGYPRANATGFAVLLGRADREHPAVFWALNLATVLFTLIIIQWFTTSLRGIVDFATITAFVTAPVLGALNLRLVYSRHMPEAQRPHIWLNLLAWLGLASLTGFTVVYILYRAHVFDA